MLGAGRRFGLRVRPASDREVEEVRLADRHSGHCWFHAILRSAALPTALDVRDHAPSSARCATATRS